MTASDLLGRLTVAYEEHRDPARAAPMARYMKDRFAFVGISTPVRRALDRAAVADLASPSERRLAAVARACWRRPEREYQYFATDYVGRHVSRCSAAFLDVTRHLIITKSWWDTVDALATHAVGPLVLNHPQLVVTMDAWIDDDDIWLVRSALLHQNRYRARTDADRLFRYCAHQAGNSEFFVRKAIGWALREYTRVDPAGVRRFVAEHESTLSGLSRREALKWLDRRAARRV